MQPLEPAGTHAGDVYWLALLLTGQPEVSVDVVVEALDLSTAANPFFSTWIQRWSRKVVIAKALAAIRNEIAESARRIELGRVASHAPRLRKWTLSRDTTKVQLERALLAIDVFPRCALLLSVFEGLSLQDLTVLLDATPGLIRKAQASALHELTRNLARVQDRASASFSPSRLPEVQHA